MEQLIPLARLLLITTGLFLEIIQILLFIRLLLSWFVSPETFLASPVLRRLAFITDPLLYKAFIYGRWFRFGMVDMSPLLLFLVLEAGRVLVQHLLLRLPV